MERRIRTRREGVVIRLEVEREGEMGRCNSELITYYLFGWGGGDLKERMENKILGDRTLCLLTRTPPHRIVINRKYFYYSIYYNYLRLLQLQLYIY